MKSTEETINNINHLIRSLEETVNKRCILLEDIIKDKDKQIKDLIFERDEQSLKYKNLLKDCNEKYKLKSIETISEIEIGDVIYIDFPHDSFKWANGLKIVLEIENEHITMGELDNEGKPLLYIDGTFMTSGTGLNNPGIKKTNLKYKL